MKDPKVAQLFLQAEVVTAIPNRFLANTNLRSLDLSVPLVRVTAIDDSFLSECSSLESINLSGLRNVTSHRSELPARVHVIAQLLTLQD